MSNMLQISLEGLDGAGKSTTTKSLIRHYESEGLEVIGLTSPSRRPTGLFLRENIFRLSSEEKEKLFIEDLKESGEAIPSTADLAIWDRHVDSIYTSNRESNLGRIAAFASGLVLPDKTFYLRLDSEMAYERAVPITDHELDKSWLDQKFERYEELLRVSSDRIIPVDASKSTDEVLREIIEHIKEIL